MDAEHAAFRALVTYEALALNGGRVPPVTRFVDPLPWWGRALVTAALAAWLVYHFRLHEFPTRVAP